jgi:hypothetical protein
MYRASASRAYGCTEAFTQAFPWIECQAGDS